MDRPLELPDGTYVQYPGGGVLAGPYAGMMCVRLSVTPVFETRLDSQREVKGLLGHKHDLVLEDDDGHRIVHSVFEDQACMWADLLRRVAF